MFLAGGRGPNQTKKRGAYIWFGSIGGTRSHPKSKTDERLTSLVAEFGKERGLAAKRVGGVASKQQEEVGWAKSGAGI